METFGTASDGTPLQWYVVKPSGSGPWPAVAMFHGGGFHGGGPTNPGLVAAANDLAAAGFICYSISYRMDKTHVPGQTLNAYWPYQTDDCKQGVVAIRNDSRCNGQVLACGESAGGCHGLSVASELSPSSGGPPWTPDDRVLAVVSLSGAYQFDDRTPDPNLPSFIKDINLYCNTASLPQQKSMSPTSLMDATCHPVYCVRSEHDPMPVGQQAALVAKFNELGVTFQDRVLPGSQHGFDYWPQIKDEAIAFLQSYI